MTKPMQYTTGDDYARGSLSDEDYAQYMSLSPEDKQFWWGTIGADHPNSSDYLYDRHGVRDQLRASRSWQMSRPEGTPTSNPRQTGNLSPNITGGGMSNATGGGLNYATTAGGQAGGVSRFIGPDYVSMMEGLYGDQQASDQALIQSHIDASQGIRGATYDPRFLEARRDAVAGISERGESAARQNVTSQSAAADTAMQQNIQNVSGQRSGVAGQYGSDISAIGQADIADAQSYQQDILQAGRGYGEQVEGQISQNLGQTQGQIQGTQEGVQGMYDQYTNQGENAMQLLDRMGSQDYSSAMMNEIWGNQADDIQARMNAAGIGGSGATAEALANAKARLTAEEMNRQFERDAQVAQMAGQYGMSGADRTAAAMESATDRSLAQENQALQQRLALADQQLGLDLQSQQQLREAQMRGYGRAEDIAQTGMAAGQQNVQDLAEFGRQAYGRDIQNIDRYGNIIEAGKSERAGAESALYSDLFANQQAAGQAWQSAQDVTTSAQRASQGDYYNKLANMYHDTAKATADATMKYDLAEMNRAVNAGSELAGLYQEQAGVRHQQASGFYNMAGTAAVNYAKGMS